MKYHLTCRFFKTEEQADRFCRLENADATPYARKHHPAHYTEWNSTDSTYHYVAWYYYKA